MKTVVIGNEYDDVLIDKLRQVLQANGAVINDQKWALGGSQDFTEYEIAIKGDMLRVEIETYIGVSISGNPALVDEIFNAIKAL